MKYQRNNDNMMYLQQAMVGHVVVHVWDGIQRLEELVSKITLNACGGVPIVISP